MENQEFKNAMFARGVDQSVGVEFASAREFIVEQAYYEADPDMVGQDAHRRKRDELMAKYNAGKSLLEQYSLRYTNTVTALSAAEDDQERESESGAAYTHISEAGYGAGTTMRYHVAVFRKRS